jgi:hypothetical protein
MSAPRAFLVATAKNEAPYFLEWVAHHLEVGFTDIVIYQNDSDDLTHETLSALRDIGAIRYFYNKAKPGAHQVRAYSRAALLPEYAAADWAMALDLDEFLVVKAGGGRLSDLVAAVPWADILRINWRLFGSSGHELPTLDLVTERFRLADRQLGPPDAFAPFKCLYRPAQFRRPGIHSPHDATDPGRTPRIANGSGLVEPDYAVQAYAATDPGGCRLAQINHYVVRDLASFVLKTQRGSAHRANRLVGRRYWTARNRNIEPDAAMAPFTARLRARMAALDAAAGGRLTELRREALYTHLARFYTLMLDRKLRAFHDFCRDRAAAPVARGDAAG